MSPHAHATARAQRADDANGARRTIVGVDFDNTLVCYDRLFHRLAAERSLLAGEVAPIKRSIRDHLRSAGREDAWTELQALAYGARITEAGAFPGARAFVSACAERSIEVFVVSHKTRFPYAGGEVDLREAARGWLEEQGFFDTGGALTPERVHFAPTREGKIRSIARLGCTHFVDDLAEFLAEPELPNGLVRILFEPLANAPDAESGNGAGEHARIDSASALLHARSWEQVEAIVFGSAR